MLIPAALFEDLLPVIAVALASALRRYDNAPPDVLTLSQHMRMFSQALAQPRPPQIGAVATRVGSGICIVLGSYVVMSVLPRWHDVTSHVEEVHLLSWPAVAGAYGIMVLSAIAHSIT